MTPVTSWASLRVSALSVLVSAILVMLWSLVFVHHALLNPNASETAQYCADLLCVFSFLIRNNELLNTPSANKNTLVLCNYNDRVESVCISANTANSLIIISLTHVINCCPRIPCLYIPHAGLVPESSSEMEEAQEDHQRISNPR